MHNHFEPSKPKRLEPKYDDAEVIVREPNVKKKSTRKVQKPNMYRVILFNDDYTPMDFVVHILETIFKKTNEEATALMLEVHNRGSAVAGVYPYDIADTKRLETETLARKKEYPLRVEVEQE